MGNAIYDLKRLFTLYEAVETLDLAAEPTAQVLFSAVLPAFPRVGILCGSFNPLTLAHTELAEQAREEAHLDAVFFTVAKVTVDKERITGLGLEDRLLVLSLYAQQHQHTGVALVNRGLYFEQAQAFRSLFGVQAELFFVVGMDKLVQILDPRYYQDRDAALRQLFGVSSLLVANRGEMARAEFDQLLQRPENRPYRSHVHFCPLPPAVAALSATAVRENLAVEKVVTDQVPSETATFLAETRVYRPPLQIAEESVDVYAVRLRLVASLYTVRSWAEREVDFRQLMDTALAPGEKGQALRRAAEGVDVVQTIRALCRCGEA